MGIKTLSRQLLGLSRADKWFLFKAICLSVFIRILLKLINFKSIRSFLSPFAKEKSHAEKMPFNIHRYHNLVNLCIRSTKLFTNCLSISLAFWTMLKRRGIDTDLKFGMIILPEKLKAHAWLEYQGEPLGDTKINLKYIPFKEAIL